MIEDDDGESLPRRSKTAEELRSLGYDGRQHDATIFSLMEMVQLHREDQAKDLNAHKKVTAAMVGAVEKRVDTIEARWSATEEKIKLQNVALFGESRYAEDTGVIGKLLSAAQRNTRLLTGVLSAMVTAAVGLIAQLVFTVLSTPHHP